MGNPSSPDVLLSFPLLISFQSILSEADNGEVIQSHLFPGPVWLIQPGGLGMKGFYVGSAVCPQCGLAPNLCDEISLRRQCYHWVWAQIWGFLSRTHTVIDWSLKHHQDCLVRLPEADSVRLGIVGRVVTSYEWLWLPVLWVFSLGTFRNPISPTQAKEHGSAYNLCGCFSLSSSKPSLSLYRILDSPFPQWLFQDNLLPSRPAFGSCSPSFFWVIHSLLPLLSPLMLFSSLFLS